MTSEPDDVIRSDSVVYTLTLADSSCATRSSRPPRAQSAAVTSPSAARRRTPCDDPRGRSGRWIRAPHAVGGRGRGLTLVDIMLTGGRSLARRRRETRRAQRACLFARTSRRTRRRGRRLYVGDGARATLADSVLTGNSATERAAPSRCRGRRGVVAPPEPQRARLEQARDFERSGRAAPLALAIWASLARLSMAFSLLSHTARGAGVVGGDIWINHGLVELACCRTKTSSPHRTSAATCADPLSSAPLPRRWSLLARSRRSRHRARPRSRYVRDASPPLREYRRPARGPSLFARA